MAWYIGRKRAKDLLDYAYSILSGYAYRIPPDRFIAIKRVLETRIPLWTEERRGPTDQYGRPLLSEKGYKDFIKIWIAKMAMPKEVKVNGARWFGITTKRRRLMGAPYPGAGGDVGLDVSPTYWRIGEQRLKEIENTLYSKAEDWLLPLMQRLQTQGNSAQLAAILGPGGVIDNAVKTVMSNVSQWTQPEMSPRDPDNNVPWTVEKGATKDFIMKDLDRMLYLALSYSLGVDIDHDPTALKFKDQLAKEKYPWDPRQAVKPLASPNPNITAQTGDIKIPGWAQEEGGKYMGLYPMDRLGRVDTSKHGYTMETTPREYLQYNPAVMAQLVRDVQTDLYNDGVFVNLAEVRSAVHGYVSGDENAALSNVIHKNADGDVNPDEWSPIYQSIEQGIVNDIKQKYGG